ncbi:hypothetical protein A0U40_03655 [[Bacillus] sp. KCTC 13219]|nr:hypothetical protein A0U40_03655 [[Bacillus] sp. KCTC 13219]
MENKTDTVLNAWYLLEAIQPKELPKEGEWKESTFTHKRKVPHLAPVEFTEKPWQQHILVDNKKTVQFHYYMQCYEQWQLIEKMRMVFRNNEELIVKDTTRNYSFTFSVNNEGKYIEDSLFIPFVHFLIKKLKITSKWDYGELLKEYESICEYIEREARTLFINGVENTSIQLLLQKYTEYFEEFVGFSKSYLEISVFYASDKNDQLNRNSYFLSDIEKALKKGANKTLNDYISGSEKRNDIDNNRQMIEEILQPKKLPLGRWPSPVAHRLSLMQQVAVNRIINGDERLHSVNGPPGTGKTTLLKDVFANIIVQRALQMITYKDPTTAFRKSPFFELDGYQYTVSYEIDDKLKTYSMVVASSNNGAVENISKDLPKRKEIATPKKNEEGILEPGIKNEYDQKIAEYVDKLAYYPETAKKLIKYEDDTWGMFSGIFGKSNNINQFIWNGLLDNNDDNSFVKQLKRDNESFSLEDWHKAVKEFQDLLYSVEQKKNDLQEYVELNKVLQSIEKELQLTEQKQLKTADSLSQLQIHQANIEESLNSLKKPNFLLRIVGFKNKDEKVLRQQHTEVVQEIKKLEKMTTENSRHENQLKLLKEQHSQENTAYRRKYAEEELQLSTDTYWEQNNNDYRQQNVIWQTNVLNYERGLLFLKAMKVHKLFLIKNADAIDKSLRLFYNRRKLNLNSSEHREYLKNAWHVIHLVTPLISTTFASFANMYKGIEQDFISYLFIDEAGQASPQLAVGALQRSKKAIIVGDPIQIEPVVTVDKTLLMDICKHFNLEEHYISTTTSVQSVADLANPYGTYKDQEKAQWIGIPLWVHRRCLDPMFSIANDIAYDNRMVLADTKNKGISQWIDCAGKAVNSQYVREQAEYMAQVIFELYQKENKLPDLFVITPFTAVVSGLKEVINVKMKPLQIPGMAEWIKRSIGTVHTFQGKEADTVYFVTGTDEQTEGAANWTCSKPNLLNVAVTRAKKEFYVVGDLKRFKHKRYYDKIVHFIEMNNKDLG